VIRAALGVALTLVLIAPNALAKDLSARNLAATCSNCHGTDGRAIGDTLKPLAGVPAERIVAAMTAFKSGAQPATVMHQIAKGFSDEQIAALAAYFAAQPATK
jgi:cytochrome c553